MWDSLNSQSITPKLMNMKLFLRKTLILLFFLSSSLSASSLTLLIDTRDSLPRDDMEINEKTRVVSLESGLMDELFDGGHIFFNMYSLKNDTSAETADKEALDYAEDIGAGFLLVLSPEEDGSSWRFFRVGSLNSVEEGFVDINETDADKNTRERWLSLGNILAEAVVPLIN